MQRVGEGTQPFAPHGRFKESFVDVLLRPEVLLFWILGSLKMVIVCVRMGFIPVLEGVVFDSNSGPSALGSFRLNVG